MMENSADAFLKSIGLTPDSVRKELRRIDGVLKSEAARMGKTLGAALKEGLNFNAALRNALKNVDIKAHKAAFKNIGDQLGKSLREGMNPPPAAEGKEDGPIGGRRRGKAMALNVNSMGIAKEILQELIKTVIDLETPVKIKEQAEDARMSMQDFQAWQGIAQSGGVDTQFNKLIETLLSMLADAKGPGPLAEYGVALKDAQGEPRDMRAVLLDLAEALRTLKSGQADTLVKDLGIDKDMRTFLSGGRSELEGRLKEDQRRFQGYTEQDAEKAQRASNALDDLQRSILDYKATLQDVLLSIAIPVIKATTEAIIEGPKLLKESMEQHNGLVTTSPPELSQITWFMSQAILDLQKAFRGNREKADIPAFWPEYLVKTGEADSDWNGLNARGRGTTGGGTPWDVKSHSGNASDPVSGYLRDVQEIVKFVLDAASMTMNMPRFLPETSPASLAPNYEITVSIDTIDIVTQATDAQGIAANIYDAVALQIVRGIPDVVDSGVRQA